MVLKQQLQSLVFIGIAILSFSFQAFADVTWKGLYRVEGNYFNSVGMANDTSKEYFLHHLRLTPKIVLLDGFELFGTLDVFNHGEFAVAGSQAGQTFGGGFTPSNNAFYGSDGSAAMTDNQIYKVRDANLAELYLKFMHTGGELTVGRAPLHFGLGMNLNSGAGDFDHWFDNRDMIAYKVFIGGAISVQPYVARITDGFSTSGDAATEYGALLRFNKEDVGLDMGAMYISRYTAEGANVGQMATSGSAKTNRYGVYLKRNNPKQNFHYGVEFGINDGNLGLNGSGEEISYNGFGLVAEVDYKTPVTGLDLGIKFGYAKGQDGSEDDAFSSFAFDRNYDVGMILFNHPVGNPDLDLFGTTPYGKQGPYFGSGNFATQNSIDSESISNTIFAAPYISYTFSPQWSIKSQWLWAQLDSDIVNSVLYATTNPGLEVEKDLGFEWDFSLTYKPFEKVHWQTTLGAFFPGKAFEGGSQGYNTDTIWGGMSRVSIRFD